MLTRCGKCGKEYEVDRSALGGKATCECGHVFVVKELKVRTTEKTVSEKPTSSSLKPVLTVIAVVLILILGCVGYFAYGKIAEDMRLARIKSNIELVKNCEKRYKELELLLKDMDSDSQKSNSLLHEKWGLYFALTDMRCTPIDGDYESIMVYILNWFKKNGDKPYSDDLKKELGDYLKSHYGVTDELQPPWNEK